MANWSWFTAAHRALYRAGLRRAARLPGDAPDPSLRVDAEPRGATLAIHLSIRNLAHVRSTLEPHYGAGCPVVIAYRATWPDEKYIRTTLAGMKAAVREAKITRTALIFVGPVFGQAEFRDSDLYNPHYAHVLRNAGKKRARRA